MTGQKHGIWVVPNYDNKGTASASNHPISYLRLGSTTTTVSELSTAALRGDDLLEEASLTTSTTAWFEDDSATNNGGVDRNHSGASTTFKRYDGNSTATSTVAALTGESRTRGGWRDHTDGNRISTTRGDRIDYVQGNYRRVIFGRVSNSVAGVIGESTWESSGGHNHDSTSTPGEVTTITWVQTQGGTWKTIERTEKGNVFERFSGELTEYFDGGSKLETYTGVDGGGDKKNPKIKERTYAKSITSTTNASSTEDDTDANDKNDVQYVHGSFTSKTFADKVNEFSLAGIANDNTNTVQHQDVTTYGTRHIFSVVLATVSLNLVAWDFTQVGNRLVPYPFEELPPPAFKIALSLKLAGSLEMFVGLKGEVHVGVVRLGARIGNEIKGSFGWSGELNIAPEIVLSGNETWIKLQQFRAQLARIDTAIKDTELAAYNSRGA